MPGNSIIDIIEKLDEMIEPYIICVCEEPTISPGDECEICNGLLPLQWVVNYN